MTTTIETPIRVRDLPKALRGGYHPDVVVQVSLKPVLTENGFTPEEEEEILLAEKEEGSMVFEDGKEALQYLKRIRLKNR
ncbi:hypothetical protein ACQZV8_01655 [Magnetococcales bacterium HHB-1]